MSSPSTLTAGAPTSRLRPEATDATRYLCAASYLDESFCRAVLDEVLYQPHRAVAPSHGISLGPVIRHALTAQRWRLVRNALVGAALLIGAIASLGAGVALLVGLLSFLLTIRALRSLVRRQVAAAVSDLLLAYLVLPLLALALVAVAAVLRFGLAGLSTFGLAAASGLSATGLALWLALLPLIWGIYLAHRLLVHRTVAVGLTPRRFDPGRSPAVNPVFEQRLGYLEQAQNGNVTVYSETAGSRPFIGFGDVNQQWSLVTPLRPAPEARLRPSGAETGDLGATADRDGGTPPVPFTVSDLYEAIRDGMAELADPHLAPEQVIPHLSIRDRVFVAGGLPVDSQFLEHGQPRFRLSEPEVKELQRSERGRVRHYQSVRMAAWGGEVEVTTFLHASIRGRMLYVEFVATVVPGIRAEYHRIDAYNRLDALAVAKAAGRSVGDLIWSPLALLALVRTGAAAIRRSLSQSSEAGRITHQLTFDYGCRSSVRELATDFDHPVRFHLYDASERINVVERRLLQVLVGFLERHHYDVRDLAGQAATVINNSTELNFNHSTLNSSSVAAGPSATANVNGRSPAGAPPQATTRSQ